MKGTHGAYWDAQIQAASKWRDRDKIPGLPDCMCITCVLPSWNMKKREEEEEMKLYDSVDPWPEMYAVHSHPPTLLWSI